MITGNNSHKVVLKHVLCVMTSDQSWNIKPLPFDFCFADINHSFAPQFIEVTMFSSLCNCSFLVQLITDEKGVLVHSFGAAFMWIANIYWFCEEKIHCARKGKERKRWECFHLTVFGIQAR